MKPHMIHWLSNSITCLILTFAYLTAGCGVEAGNPSTRKPKGAPIDIGFLVKDPQLTGSIVNALHEEAVATAFDQGISSGSSLLTTKDEDQDSSVVNKSCEPSTDQKQAIVSISSTINRTKTRTAGAGKIILSWTGTGSGNSRRTWSKSDGTSVACNTAGTGAAIDFRNPENLILEVSFQRSRDIRVNYSGPRATRTASRSSSSSGEWSVKWSSGDSPSDGQTYVRAKSVTMKSVKKNLIMTNRMGVTFETELSMNTADTSPMVVQVERDSISHAIQSKTFVSGEVVLKKDSDAILTTTYNKLKLDFKDGSCSISDGSADITIKDAAGTTLKNWTLGVDSNGDTILKDDSGEEVEGFTVDPCDAENLRL
jgi:hypothetical protein